MQTLPKRAFMAYQGQVVTAILGLANFGCGASLQRAMLALLIQIYTQGDFTKMQAEFFDQLMPVIVGTDKKEKTANSGHLKLNACYLTSKLFQQLWMRSHTPPTKDLIEGYFKIGKNSPEKHLKEAAFKAIKSVVKANASNFYQISSDFFKNLQKALQSCDKSPENTAVKADMVACLRVFVSSTLNYSALHQYFEQILATCIKGFEDTNSAVTEEYIQTCYHLFNLRLQESQQQGDLKTTFRLFNQQQREAQAAAAGKKKLTGNLPQFIDVPRTLGDVASFLSAILLKIQANSANPQATLTMDNLRYAVSQVLVRLVEKNKLHLKSTEIEVLLTPLLLSCNYSPVQKAGVMAQLTDQETSIKQRETVSWALTQVIKSYQGSERSVSMLKMCLLCLSQKQISGMQKDTLETFSGFSKNMKVSSMMNETQSIIALRAITEILYHSNQAFVKENFTSFKEVLDPIMPFIKDNHQSPSRYYALELLKTLGHRAKFWLNDMISHFLSMCTMVNADISTVKQVPIYSNIHSTQKGLQETSTMNPQAQALHDSIQNLNALSIALGCLISGIQGGVPLTLASACFTAAKGMILGNYRIEDEEDEALYQNDIQRLNQQETQRRQAGWHILEGLISLGNQWMGTKLSVFFKLLNSAFSKEMCNVNAIQLKDPTYFEKVLTEFKIKRAALQTVLSFLKKCNVILNTQLWKLMGTFLVNAISFFINHDKDKKDIIIAFKQHFSEEEHRQIKGELFECLNLLPSTSLYSAKFVHILHSVCEEIVNENLNHIPSIQTILLHFEDLQLGKSQTKQSKYSALVNRDTLKTFNQTPDKDSLEHLDIVQNYESSILTFLLRFDRPSSLLSHTSFQGFSQDTLHSHSIKLFGDIFASQNLNIKNKQQLLKHLIVHSTNQQTIMQGKDKKIVQNLSLQKVMKIISIGLACLGVCKSVAKKGDIIDGEIMTQIQLIFKNCEQVNDPILIKIQAEGLVFLRIPSILKEPKSTLDLILKEQEVTLQQLNKIKGQEDGPKRALIIAILGNLIRYLDFETLIQPFTERILSLFTTLGKDNSPLSREFYIHYCHIIVKRAGQEYPQFYASNFQTCFHQVQSDIKTNMNVLTSLYGMIQEQLRHDFGSTVENKRALIAVNEVIDSILLSKSEWSRELTVKALEIVKTILIIDSDLISERIPKIISKLLSFIYKNPADLDIKMKSVELLASFIYKGYIMLIKDLIAPKSELSPMQIITSFILEDLNSTQTTYGSVYNEGKLRKKLNSQAHIEKCLTSNEDFEKLINFKHQHYFDNETQLQGFASENERNSAKLNIYMNGLEVLLLMAFKILAGISPIQELIDSTKFVVSYKHQSIIQDFDESKKAVGEKQPDNSSDYSTIKIGQTFSSELNERVRYFAIRMFKNFIQHFATVDNPANPNDLRKHLGALISLGFAIISSDSSLLKKSGFSLVIVLVKLFKTTIEKMRDEEDDEEQSVKDKIQQRIRAYLENPLLLEQYEAQIFSIIRQNLTLANSDPTVILKNYKLIYQFLTIPICKDPSIVSKIFAMLTDSMGTMQIFNANDQSEKLITELHFKKLTLLSKLLIICLEDKQFKRIETNPKRVLAHNDDEESSDLPSKFQKDDKKRILDNFTPEIMQTLLNNIVTALQDTMLITTMPKQALKNLKQLTFIRGSSRSAYNLETIEKSTQLFIKALTLIKLSLKDEQSTTLQCLLTHLLAHPNEQQKKKEPEIDSLVTSNTLKAKLFYLQSLLKMVQDGKIAIKDKVEIEYYQSILTQLYRYGVTDLNCVILQFYSQLGPDTQSDFYHKIVLSLIACQPEIVGGDRTSEQIDGNLVKICLESMLQVLKQTSDETIVSSILGLSLDKIPQILGCVEDLQAMKLYSAHVQNVMSATKEREVCKLIVKESVVRLIGTLSKCTDFNRGAQHQVVILCSMILSQPNIDDLALNKDLINLATHVKIPMLIPTLIKVLTAQISQATVQVMRSLFDSVMSLVYEILKQSDSLLPDSQANLLQDSLSFLINTCYTKLSDKVDALQLLILCIFTVIQAKQQVPPNFRNQQVENIYHLFTLDGSTFKEVLMKLNTPERTLVENVIRQLSAAKQSTTQQTLAPQNAHAVAAKTGDMTKSATSGAAPGGGSIQLTMNFGGKKK